MANKYDLSHFGKRAVKKVNKLGGDNFLDKIIANRNIANGLWWDGTPKYSDKRRNAGFGTQKYIEYPCVGPCLDENGNLVWVPNAKAPLDRQDIFKITGTDFDSVEMDPMSYTEDKDPLVREFSRGLISGKYSFGKGVEELIDEKGWNKFSKVYDDGSVLRNSNVYSPIEYNHKTHEYENIGTSRNGHYVRDRRDFYERPRDSRNKPYRYLHVLGPVEGHYRTVVGNEKGKFVDPDSILGSDLKKMKKRFEWNLDDWDMRKVKNNGRYSINDRIDNRVLRQSRKEQRVVGGKDNIGETKNRLFSQRKDDIIGRYEKLLDNVKDDILNKGNFQWSDYKRLFDRKIRELDRLRERMGIKYY